MYKIDYSIHSPCFPFEWAKLHREMAEVETTAGGGRIHQVVGYLECIPLVNYIVALFDRIILGCRGRPYMRPAALRAHVSLTADNAHFQISDIQLIAKKSIGLRHVSSHEAMTQELENGVAYGCAFNLTFQKSEHDWEQGFECLPEELQSDLSVEAKLEKVQAYEQAVNGNLTSSIIFDLIERLYPIIPGQTTYGQICSAIQNTKFLIIDYKQVFAVPTDFPQYHQLGRFPKSPVPSTEIKGALSDFEAAKIGVLDLDSPVPNIEQYEALKDKIVDWFRAELLQFLRENHAQFTERVIFRRAV